MGNAMTAIEVEGSLDEQGALRIDAPLPIAWPNRVRVLILLPEPDAPDEREWLRAAAASPAFDFLADAAEDVYGPADGKPFVDQG
jgi:hypothetical protein